MRKLISAALLGVAAATATAHPIDFESIRHWTGKGPNRAALVIQYSGEKFGSDAYVWGFRWEDGETPTSEDMFRAVCANSSRLSLLTQQTGTSGNTVCGIGYGLNQEALKHLEFDLEAATNSGMVGFDYLGGNPSMGQTSSPGAETQAIVRSAIEKGAARTHVVEHPFDQQTYGYPAYDYDFWKIDNSSTASIGQDITGLKWLSGWYTGYWGYWTAAKQSDELGFASDGFSKIRLTDNSVHAWYYSSFDADYSEPGSPCGGNIVYMPSRLVEGGVDQRKALRDAGEGSRSIPVVINWNSERSIDNIVYNYHFDNRFPDAAKLIADLASADDALKATTEGNSITEIAFDANGDGIINPDNGDATANGEWKLTEYEDCLLLSAADKATPDYLFYLPAADATGVWIPENLGFSLSDADNYVPVLVRPKAEHDALNYTWYRRTDDSAEHGNTSTDIISSIASGAATNGKLTYKGSKVGTVYLHVRARIGKGSDYAYSNICRLELAEPEIPITGLKFRDAEVESGLNAKIDNPLTIIPENATYTKVNYTSTNTKIVTTALATTTTAGEAVITVESVFNPAVKASFKAVTRLMNPVEEISIKGVEGNTIELTPKGMIGLIGKITPANADVQTFDVALEGVGTSKADFIASAFKVNYWDENNTRIQFYELSGHRTGECKLVISAQDGSGYKREYNVKVVEPDRTPLENGYLDGTVYLNEEWFGHTNGGLNYITPEGEMMYQVYERENPGMAFGASSQYATIWAGKLLVSSKQDADKGDPLPGGGRFVVADAATLKRIGSLDSFMIEGESKSGDGRAIAGATPTKAYVGTTQGIYIVDLETVAITGKLPDTTVDGTATGTGQVGDMVTAGRHVFAIKQNSGVLAINVETDQIDKLIPSTSVQGITLCADGNVWVAAVENGCAKFICIDPETLEEKSEHSVVMPANVGQVTCSWGSWRSTSFCGSKEKPVLWFYTGVSGIAGGNNGGYYCWEIGTAPEEARLVFSLDNPQLDGSNTRVKQKAYGTMRYDDRTDELIISTVDNSSSGHYRYNWIHFIDSQTGAIKRTINMRPYYWFPCFALFPDKYDAEIGLEDITLGKSEGEKVIDLAEVVSDRDNIDAHIRLSLVEEPAAPREATAVCADVNLEGKTLTVAPLAPGSRQITLAAESNGRSVSKTISVTVTDASTGIDNAGEIAKGIACDGRRIYLTGLSGVEFSLYDLNGVELNRFVADEDHFVAEFAVARGIYLLKGSDGSNAKIILDK